MDIKKAGARSVIRVIGDKKLDEQHLKFADNRPCARLELNRRNAEVISKGYEELRKFDDIFIIHILWRAIRQ